jgi:hypothetical protein
LPFKNAILHSIGLRKLAGEILLSGSGLTGLTTDGSFKVLTGPPETNPLPIGHLPPGLLNIFNQAFNQPKYPKPGTATFFDKGISQTLAALPSVVLMGNADGVPGSDLVLGTFPPDNSTPVAWTVAPSTFCLFTECLGPSRHWGGVGPIGDFYRLGDTDGDGRADLVFADAPGRFVPQDGDPSAAPAVWSVSHSSGGSFRAPLSWHSAGGQDGDVIP